MADWNSGGNIFYRPNKFRGIGKKFATRTDIHALHHTTFALSRLLCVKWKPAVNAEGEQLYNPHTGEAMWLRVFKKVLEAGEWVGVEASERHDFIPLPERIKAKERALLDKFPANSKERAELAYGLKYQRFVGFVCMYSHVDAMGDVVQSAALGDWRNRQ